MTGFLVALVPVFVVLLPALLVPRRRRSLSLLRSEVDLLNAMPKGTPKRDIEDVVSEGVASYFDRYISRDPIDVARRQAWLGIRIVTAVLPPLAVMLLLDDQVAHLLGIQARAVSLGVVVVSTVGVLAASLFAVRYGRLVVGLERADDPTPHIRQMIRREQRRREREGEAGRETKGPQRPDV